MWSFSPVSPEGCSPGRNNRYAWPTPTGKDPKTQEPAAAGLSPAQNSVQCSANSDRDRLRHLPQLVDHGEDIVDRDLAGAGLAMRL
jgi:hypothetical protein